MRNAFFVLLLSIPAVAQDHSRWSDYGGAVDSAQFSSLTQIRPGNVSHLKVAWSFATGDHRRYAFNPLIAGNLAFVLAENNTIVALDASTGRQIWTHAANPDSRLITSHGLNYWENSNGSERRLFFAENNQLHALDAATGKIISTFGRNGSVDLREGLGRNPDDVVLVQSNTPGKIFGDLLILGSATNQEYESAPGDIRAYNVRDGKLVWTFHTIPHPGEFGYDTWPADAWKRVGGANAWGELSIDEKRGIVYVPTGSPKYNFYGANRKGANLFGDCLLALDARTGKRLWHFQMVHHDIWDYDDCTAPKLITVHHNGQDVDAVAEVSKQGFIWVFNRVTGEPLWPIEERPVPQTDMDGEQTWRTQPFPTNPPPFARQKFTVDDLSPYLEDAERAHWRDELLSARNEGLFTPPGTSKTVQMPGNNGGANWGSAAINPANGMLYVTSKDMPAMLKLEPEQDLAPTANATPEQAGEALYRAKCQLCHHADLKGQPPTVPALRNISARLTDAQIEQTIRQGGGLMPGNPTLSAADLDHLVAFLRRNVTATTEAANKTLQTSSHAERYRSGFNFMVAKNGLSPIAPPWTSLTAYDLNEGTIKWKIPLGEVPELAAKGIKNTGSHLPKVGPVVTASGLIFTGTRDRKVRAIDAATGQVLWEAKVNAALEGMPAVYAVNGRQYVLFCAAAPDGAQGEVTNGAYVSFALPVGETHATH